MNRVAIAMAIALAGASGAADAQRHFHRNRGPIAEYSARLSHHDHYNSYGERLTTVAAIIRQDRANFHRFGDADREDEGDPFFANAAHRADLENMVRRGDISPAAQREIIEGNPLVHVEIYDDYVVISVE
jgi:hypothetical protein